MADMGCWANTETPTPLVIIPDDDGGGGGGDDDGDDGWKIDDEFSMMTLSPLRLMWLRS